MQSEIISDPYIIDRAQKLKNVLLARTQGENDKRNDMKGMATDCLPLDDRLRFGMFLIERSIARDLKEKGEQVIYDSLIHHEDEMNAITDKPVLNHPKL